MPGRTADAAVAAYLAARHRVAACVTAQPIRVTGYRVMDQGDHSLSFAPLDASARVRSARGVRLGLTTKEFFRVEQSSIAEFLVRRTAYRYHVLDRFDRELLAFHWHPTGVSAVIRPHLHLTGRLAPVRIDPDNDPIAFGGMHIPTGPIDLADVVELLIEDFDIEPRRSDWRDVLQAEAILATET